MTAVLSKEQKLEIAENLLGSCDSLSWKGEKYGVEGDELGLVAEEYGVWRCETCGWWVEEGELAVEADGDVICQDCYDEENKWI